MLLLALSNIAIKQAILLFFGEVKLNF